MPLDPKNPRPSMKQRKLGGDIKRSESEGPGCFCFGLGEASPPHSLGGLGFCALIAWGGGGGGGGLG